MIHFVHSLGLGSTEVLVPAITYITYTIPTLCFMFGWLYVHLLTIQTIGCIPMEGVCIYGKNTHTCTNTNTIDDEVAVEDMMYQGHTQYT